jgi:hypothetical protein
MRCVSCDKETGTDDDVCVECYRAPATNRCERCDRHLIGIRYAYVCGPCISVKLERKE